jgi:hypothetical protein
MRNVIISGSGRSGTSMVAGVLAKSGYFMGDHLYPARESNPKGFYEDPEINGINEALVAQVIPQRPRLLGRWFFRSRPLEGQRWLARVPVGTKIPSLPIINEHIRKTLQREPFCFKDPRFSYTLPVWRPFLKNTVFVCIFRDPASTALSIVKECRDAEYLHSLSVSFQQALEVWNLMYRHILDVHRHEGAWLFLHYNQVLSGEGLERLEDFVDAPVDRSFPDPSLNRSFSDDLVPEEVARVYQHLCEIAEYEGTHEGS